MKYRLQDLIDIEQFQVLQDRLNEIYSFPSAIIDNDGNILTATAWQEICTHFHRRHPDCERECVKSDQYILAHISEANPAVSYRCPHGLVDNATPIMVEGVHLGNFFTGQFFLEEPNLDFFRAQAAKYGFDEQAYLEAVTKVPIWTQQKLDSYLFFIKGLIEVITGIALKNLRAIEAREKIQESERQFQAMFDTASIGIAQADPRTGQWVRVNQKMCEITGYAAEELCNLKIREVTHPEDRERDFEAFQRVVRGEAHAYQLEKRYVRKDGALVWVNVNMTVIRDADGQPVRTMATIEDITERKRQEEERAKLESQLRQAQKMESVGRLAGGVAHDFNNMIQAILGNVDLAMYQIPAENPVRELLKEICDCAQRSADLTRQLLAFARRQPVEPRVLNLNDTIAGMTKMLERLLGEHIHLNWRPGEELWPVKVDPSQIDQLLANLCVNARDAIKDVGQITIETGNRFMDEDYDSEHAGFAPGHYVRIAVSDNGRGMDSDTLAHIFEPFFTTKGVGEGTGLGLATVYGIVKQNHGYVNVYSEVGHGSTFSIYLPRHEGMDEREVRIDPVVESASRGHETILLVEDEASVLRLTSRMLTRLGYTVIAASSSDEAIRIADARAAEIQLLMTDVIMPNMSGRDLARTLQVRQPKLKRLFMSGYTADAIAHHGVLEHGIDFIQKPFTTRDLAAKLREVLERP